MAIFLYVIMTTFTTATATARKPRAKKPVPPPTSAIVAYKVLQKALHIKWTVIDGVRIPAEQIDFLSEAGAAMRMVVELAFQELGSVQRNPCVSKVPNKEYFVFSGTYTSRPVNKDLFESDTQSVLKFFETLEAHKGDTKAVRSAFEQWDRDKLQKTLYSVSMAFCCAIDIQKQGDKKTPGTLFEYFIGYLFSCVLGVNPKRSTTFAHRNRNVTLPTDLMFDMGDGCAGFHVPVKTSTRERVIQVWAHQRVIDGVLGQDEYLGTPVFLTETKYDKSKNDVVEICLPEQWQLYQGHIAKLSRIYYLDIPAAYAALSVLKKRPISVRPFADFFVEAENLAHS